MIARIPILVLTLVLGACQAYDVSVNDRIVYTPRPLLSDYQLADPALQRCVERAINRDKISQAAGLKTLSCVGEGITRLDGLGLFSGLQVVDLRDNNLSSIAALSQLIALQEIYLSDNSITDPLPLAELQALHTVDLSDNATLHCPDGQALLRVSQLRLPRHCR